MRSDNATRKILVTYQSLSDHEGGASSVTAWVLQALAEQYEVWLATPDPHLEWASLDRLYGTSLAQSEIRHYRLHTWKWLRRVPPRNLRSLRLASAYRDPIFRTDFDGLVFNMANEMTFRGVAISYVNCPIRHAGMVSELYEGHERWARIVNNYLFTKVSGYDANRFRKSICIADGEWVAAALRRHYGIESRIIHAPVVTAQRKPRSFEDRQNGYICVGRITSEKRTHEAIEIVDGLRAQGHDTHLHIVGPESTSKYMRRIRELVATRPYVALDTNLSRLELLNLMNSHRFGLHMMRNEHFGLAVAEMAAAGVLVMAHRSAGPIEILGPKSGLLFDDKSEAAKIALQLQENDSFRRQVLFEEEKDSVEKRFGAHAFMEAIASVVAEVFENEDAS